MRTTFQRKAVFLFAIAIAVAGCRSDKECRCDGGTSPGDETAASGAGRGATPEPVEPGFPGSEETRHQFNIDNAFYYDHVSGGGKRTPTLAYVLFEHAEEKSVKYQVAYIACTCRGPSVNYYSVAYVELSREDGSVVYLSYDKDSSGHYSPGLYGDSTVTGGGTPVKDMFEAFKRENLVGRSQGEILAIPPMHGEVDGYTGATVTPNNAVAMLAGLFSYHNARYIQ